MRLLILYCCLIIPIHLHGQGIIVFQNSASNVNAPVTNVAGVPIVGPSSYVADLFFNTNTQAAMDDLSAFNMPVGFSSNPGYFFGGIRYSLPVPTLVQVRVWDTASGSSFYQAKNNGGEFGYSNFLIVFPEVPPAMGAYLVGLQGFKLQRLPRLTGVLTSTNTIVLSWPTAQTGYLVQQNADLSPTNWTTLSNAPVTIGQQQEVVVPVPTTGRMFYRLVSQY